MAIDETVVVNQTVNEVLISSPGPQGPRGKTILNGMGAPANNLGLEGDFYYDTAKGIFYGPKLSDLTWAGAVYFSLLNQTLAFSWELAQVNGPVNGIYSVPVEHDLGYQPNVTVITSGGDILETGIVYNDDNNLTLTMAQPFSGTAYLS